MKKVIASFVILALTFMVLAAVLIATGHASVSGNQSKLLREPYEVYQNPYRYLLALPIDGQILESKYTVIRFQPYATPEIYDETLLFCGDVTPMFEGKRGPMVITYRVRASQMYKGIACHDLINVFEVSAK